MLVGGPTRQPPEKPDAPPPVQIQLLEDIVAYTQFEAGPEESITSEALDGRLVDPCTFCSQQIPITVCHLGFYKGKKAAFEASHSSRIPCEKKETQGLPSQ